MQGFCCRATVVTLLSFLSFLAAGMAQETPTEVIISVAEQKIMVVRDGMWTHKFRVSTSKFGLGDSYGSYKTPLGKLRVCDKIGGGLASGSVIKSRHATGEILPVNAAGRDPIVTRILWLEGCEPGNEHAKARGIYIHGTVEESKIGDPASYGCIRMRSREVIEVFDAVPVGTMVTIQNDKLPKLRRWTAQPAATFVSNKASAANDERQSAKAAAEKTATEKEPRQVAEKLPPARARRIFENDGHRVLSKNAASELRRAHGAGFSNASEAMKGSILFADLPGQSSGSRSKGKE